MLTDGNGEPAHPHAVYEAFRRVVHDAGVPAIRFHDLRHTHGSLLIRDGIPVKVVSERLGHADMTSVRRRSMSLDLDALHFATGQDVQDRVAVTARLPACERAEDDHAHRRAVAFLGPAHVGAAMAAAAAVSVLRRAQVRR